MVRVQTWLLGYICCKWSNGGSLHACRLALSGLSSEDLGAAAAALPLLQQQQQQHLFPQHQQQLQGVVGLQAPWPYTAAAAAEDPQQQAAQQQASRHNQPMQRMQGFDIMK